MPLGGVAFSRLDWLWWGRIFNRVTGMGSHIFGSLAFEVRQPSYLRLVNVAECLCCRWIVKCSSFNPKNRSIHKIRKWLSWDPENYIFAQKWLRCMASIIVRGSERPAAHTQQKFTQVPPRGVFIRCSHWILKRTLVAFLSISKAMCSNLNQVPVT